MTPSARLQMAIEILEALETTAQPADRFLKDWFRARRFAGSGDRRAIAERVFAVLRHRAAFAHRMGDDHPRALVIAALLAEGEDPAALFTGGYGPAPLSEAERAAVATTPARPAGLGAGRISAMAGKRTHARFRRHGCWKRWRPSLAGRPVDLRVNTLKAARDDVLAGLAGARRCGSAHAVAPHGIRIAPARAAPGCTSMPLFESGAFEIQDQAAQIAVGAGRRTARHAGAGSGGGRGRQVAGAGGGDGERGRDHRLRRPGRGAGRTGKTRRRGPVPSSAADRACRWITLPPAGPSTWSFWMRPAAARAPGGASRN